MQILKRLYDTASNAYATNVTTHIKRTIFNDVIYSWNSDDMRHLHTLVVMKWNNCKLREHVFGLHKRKVIAIVYIIRMKLKDFHMHLRTLKSPIPNEFHGNGMWNVCGHRRCATLSPAKINVNLMRGITI